MKTLLTNEKKLSHFRREEKREAMLNATLTDLTRVREEERKRLGGENIGRSATSLGFHQNSGAFRNSGSFGMTTSSNFGRTMDSVGMNHHFNSTVTSLPSIRSGTSSKAKPPGDSDGADLLDVVVVEGKEGHAKRGHPHSKKKLEPWQKQFRKDKMDVVVTKMKDGCQTTGIRVRVAQPLAAQKDPIEGLIHRP